MPARTVIVHDDPRFIELSAGALGAAGHQIRAFSSSMAAIDALQADEPAQLLITRIAFPQGQPNGVSLARMARVKWPGIRILFVGRPENREHTEGVGEFLAAPVAGNELVEAVDQLLRRSGNLP